MRPTGWTRGAANAVHSSAASSARPKSRYRRPSSEPPSSLQRSEDAMQTDTSVESAASNDPRAPRMGAVAWLSHNIIIGSIFGTAGVLLIPLQDRLHVSRGLASIGVPMVMVGSAVLASVAGVLAARYSLRRLMAVSGVSMSLAWLILAFAHSYWLFLLAYALFLGPALAVGGAVLPPTLVTRWFHRHRGRAIGIVH